jgi:hypothetical protein
VRSRSVSGRRPFSSRDSFYRVAPVSRRDRGCVIPLDLGFVTLLGETQSEAITHISLNV